MILICTFHALFKSWDGNKYLHAKSASVTYFNSKICITIVLVFIWSTFWWLTYKNYCNNSSFLSLTFLPLYINLISWRNACSQPFTLSILLGKISQYSKNPSNNQWHRYDHNCSFLKYKKSIVFWSWCQIDSAYLGSNQTWFSTIPCITTSANHDFAKERDLIVQYVWIWYTASYNANQCNHVHNRATSEKFRDGFPTFCAGMFTIKV